MDAEGRYTSPLGVHSHQRPSAAGDREKSWVSNPSTVRPSPPRAEKLKPSPRPTGHAPPTVSLDGSGCRVQKEIERSFANGIGRLRSSRRLLARPHTARSGPAMLEVAATPTARIQKDLTRSSTLGANGSSTPSTPTSPTPVRHRNCDGDCSRFHGTRASPTGSPQRHGDKRRESRQFRMEGISTAGAMGRAGWDDIQSPVHTHQYDPHAREYFRLMASLTTTSKR